MPHDIIEPEQTMLDELSDTGRAAVALAVQRVKEEIAASEGRIIAAIEKRDNRWVHTYKKIFSNILGILKDPEL